MQFIEYLAGIPQSFFTKKFYQKIVDSQRFPRIAFLFLTILIIFVPLNAISFGRYRHFIEGIIVQIPTLEIQNGKMYCNAPQPYVIANPQSGGPFVIIDTTGSTDSLEDSEAVLLIAEDYYLLKQDDDSSISYNYDDFGDLQIDNWSLLEMVRQAVPWLFIFFLILNLFLALLLSILITYGIGSVFYYLKVNKSLSFRDVHSVCCASVIPAHLFWFISSFFPDIPWSIRAPLYMLIFACYTFFALKSIHKSLTDHV